MKRSEMLQLIYRQIHTTYGDDETYEVGTPRKLANEILETIEKAGMLPPWYIPKNQKFTDPDDKLGQWSSLNEICDWEPESDLFSINPEEYEKWKKNE